MSSKKKKDPNRPKRPITPFLYYACTRRKEIAHEKLSLGDQSRKIAVEWNKMSEPEKEPFCAKAKIDRARYNREMETYVPPKKVKRPRSAYAFFMQMNRARIAANYPDKSPRDLMVKIAEAWRAVEDRNIYKNKAVEDKQRYENEKKEDQKNKEEEKQ